MTIYDKELRKKLWVDCYLTSMEGVRNSDTATRMANQALAGFDKAFAITKD